MKRYPSQNLETTVLMASLAAQASKNEDEKTNEPEAPCCIKEECCNKSE